MTHNNEAIVEAMYSAAANKTYSDNRWFVEATGEVILGERGANVLIRETNLDGLTSCRWIWISDDLCVAALA